VPSPGIATLLRAGCSLICKNRSRGQIRVYGIAKYHGHSHGRSNNEIRNPAVARLYNIRAPNQQFAIMPLADHRLNPLLNRRPEMAYVECVNPAVHEAKAIRRTYRRVTGHVQNASPMYLNKFQSPAELLPGFGESVVNRG